MTANAYDALASHYVEYARTRAEYCNAIDRWIVSRLPPRVHAVLDVGSGDGGRAVRLAAAASASRVVLSDPSVPMVEQCRLHSGVEVWPCAAEDLPAGPSGFDVVTCLWNVLGAVEGTARRVEALRRMRACLAPGGRLFMDVHNRYNVATAGAVRVGSRLLRDRFRPAESNGAIAFTWRVAGQAIPSRGYLFTRRELLGLVAKARLRVEDQAFVDYQTGRERGPWSGQLVVALAAA